MITALISICSCTKHHHLSMHFLLIMLTISIQYFCSSILSGRKEFLLPSLPNFPINSIVIPCSSSIVPLWVLHFHNQHQLHLHLLSSLASTITSLLISILFFCSTYSPSPSINSSYLHSLQHTNTSSLLSFAYALRQHHFQLSFFFLPWICCSCKLSKACYCCHRNRSSPSVSSFSSSSSTALFWFVLACCYLTDHFHLVCRLHNYLSFLWLIGSCCYYIWSVLAEPLQPELASHRHLFAADVLSNLCCPHDCSVLMLVLIYSGCHHHLVRHLHQSIICSSFTFLLLWTLSCVLASVSGSLTWGRLSIGYFIVKEIWC